MAKKPVIPKGVDKDLKILGKYTSALDQLKQKVDNDNRSLAEFASIFSQINNEMRELIKLSKGSKFYFNYNTPGNGLPNNSGNAPSNNSGNNSDGRSNTSGRNRDTSLIIEGQFKDLNKEIIKSTDTLEKELTSKLTNLAGAVIGGVSKNSSALIYSNIGSAIKSTTSMLGSGKKAIQLGFEASKAKKLAATAQNASVAAGAKDTAAAASATQITATAGAFIAAGAAVTALGVAAKIAADRQAKVARSLAVMGYSVSGVSKTAAEVQNKQIKLGNAFENVIDNISSEFIPLLNLLEGALLGLIESLGGNTNTSKVKRLNTIGDISVEAQQSGFNVGTADVFAKTTYDLGEKLQETQKFGKQTADDIAKNLADAWLTGSDAAKEYGAVVDDQTLIGYTASQGIDIVNVEISDAMKQYYRFLLLQEEVSASSREAMSQQIKSWKQYGQLIDSTKQKLFSFDEVIQLTAIDTTIPELRDTGLDENIEGLKPENEPTDANKFKSGFKIDSDGMDAAANKMGDAANKNDEAADKMKDAADKNDEAANKADEAANKHDEAANKADEAANKADEAANKEEDAANKHDEAANKNEDAANKNTEAANTNNTAANTNTEAANTNSNAATGMGEASNGMNTAATTVKTSLEGVDNKFSNGANKLKEAIESGLNKGSQALESAMTNAGASITLQLSTTTQLGIQAVQSAGTTLINALYEVGAKINAGFQSNASQINANLNNVGNAWVSKLNAAGNAIMGKLGGIYNSAAVQAFQSKIGSRLGAKSNISFSNTASKASNTTSNTSSNSSLSKNKLDVIAQLGARFNRSNKTNTSTNTSSKTNASNTTSKVGRIGSKLDWILEAGDFVNSLKDSETGKYDLSRVPGSAAGMLASSIFQPAIAFGSGYYDARRLGMDPVTSAIGGGMYSLGYGLSETTGDVLNLAGSGLDLLAWATKNQTIKNIADYQYKSGEAWDAKMSEVFLHPNSYKDVDGTDLRPFGGLDDSVHSILKNAGFSGFASGGIGTKESLINAFEGDKAEAVIPLESQQGVDYLANALQQAGAGDGGGSSSVVVNVNLSGLNLADNDAQWERVGRKISEVIEIQNQRRGKLSYGSK